ncbi:uncharacterized protein EDB91DRAFT_1249300 [Suillus paluster]|uniref:uncharacterized protein n=1 Tax=Suillus paluster TaxID=48578 RepID=UPI001B866E96|nr:uncharacterized protein EDB91DRAFT_1249300 [Suillus paluster]KAG1738383.1 hypothetical protein EDB91DRAFT_1249300 [Suillus paluster]
MSHLSGNTFDDESDEEPVTESVAIPGPNTSKGDLIEVQVQKLVEDNHTLREENKVLIAEKPKRKCRVEAPDELLAHEQTIMLFARKYGLTVEMFPDSNLLSKPRPENPTPFDSLRPAFLDELFQHFPDRIHSAMESLYFSDLVMKSISEARSSEINKLRGVTGDIFGLPGMKYMDMLGVSATNPKYKTFPPVLFLGMWEDSSLKTVFGNWELLAKFLKAALRGVTSLHQETTGRPKTNARKWNFEQVTPGSIAWATCHCDLSAPVASRLSFKTSTEKFFGSTKSSASDPAGQEDHSSEITRAMNALDIDSDSESDLPAPSSTAQTTTVTASRSDVIKAARPPEHFAQLSVQVLLLLSVVPPPSAALPESTLKYYLQLVVSRTLLHHLKLTAIYDISGAWEGGVAGCTTALALFSNQRFSNSRKPISPRTNLASSFFLLVSLPGSPAPVADVFGPEFDQQLNLDLRLGSAFRKFCQRTVAWTMPTTKKSVSFNGGVQSDPILNDWNGPSGTQDSYTHRAVPLPSGSRPITTKKSLSFGDGGLQPSPGHEGWTGPSRWLSETCYESLRSPETPEEVP